MPTLKQVTEMSLISNQELNNLNTAVASYYLWTYAVSIRGKHIENVKNVFLETEASQTYKSNPPT